MESMRRSSDIAKVVMPQTIKRKMTFIASVFFIGLILITNGISCYHATTDLKTRLKNNLEEIASLMASEIDVAKHTKIISEKDQQTPSYKKFFAQLLAQKSKFKKITYVYTMRINKEGKVVYVIDADNGPDGNMAPGSLYEDADEGFTKLVATLNAPASDDQFMTDKWGTWLSGYAPLLTKDGKLDGILGVDMDANDVIELQHRILYSTLVLTAGASVLAFILAHLLASFFTAPIHHLITQMSKMAEGDFSATIKLPNKNDEIAVLANSYNQMTDQLNRLFGELESELRKSRAIEQKMRQGEERLLQTLHMFKQPILVIEDNIVVDCNNSSLEFFGTTEKLDIVNNEIDILTDAPSTREILDNAEEKPEKPHMLSFRTARGGAVTHLISVNTLYINETYLQILIIHPNKV